MDSYYHLIVYYKDSTRNITDTLLNDLHSCDFELMKIVNRLYYDEKDETSQTYQEFIDRYWKVRNMLNLGSPVVCCAVYKNEFIDLTQRSNQILEHIIVDDSTDTSDSEQSNSSSDNDSLSDYSENDLLFDEDEKYIWCSIL